MITSRNKALEVFSDRGDIILDGDIYYIVGSNALRLMDEYFFKNVGSREAVGSSQFLYGGVIRTLEEYKQDPKIVESVIVDGGAYFKPLDIFIVEDEENGVVFTTPTILILKLKQ